MLLNCGQLLYIIYLLRPIYFDPVLEEAYDRVFKPMAVTRLQFKKLVTAGDSAHRMSAASRPRMPFSTLQVRAFCSPSPPPTRALASC